MKQLRVIKIGGNIIDDENTLAEFLDRFAELKGNKILVHGGGKLASGISEKLGIHPKLVDGRRITDADTLRVVTMVYAGYINKNLVAQLNARGCSSIGLTGADASAIISSKRNHPEIDYGYVGDIKRVNKELLIHFLHLGLTTVIAPITQDASGQLLNTNADTIASGIAAALAEEYLVDLIYSFDKPGVLRNSDDNNSLIRKIDASDYNEIKKQGGIHSGMLPKLDNAFNAIDGGVARVIIGNALELSELVDGSKGTIIENGNGN